MFFQAKSVSLKIAVIAFLAISIACQVKDIDAFVCLKRAFIGALAAYIICTTIIKAVNSLLLSAMINKQLEEQIGDRNDDKN